MYSNVRGFNCSQLNLATHLRCTASKGRTRYMTCDLLCNVLLTITGSTVSSGSSELMTVNNFLCVTEIDNINLFSLLRFCEKSLIARKLSGFSEKLHRDKQVQYILQYI